MGEGSLSVSEVDRLMRLAELQADGNGATAKSEEGTGQKPSWKDVIFGRKPDARKEELEFEKIKKQWEEGQSHKVT